jgi:hypothetical protein
LTIQEKMLPATQRPTARAVSFVGLLRSAGGVEAVAARWTCADKMPEDVIDVFAEEVKEED